MKITLAHNHFDEKHLAEVVSEMRTLGTPKIKVYEIEEDWYQAIEGCHRIRACEILGIVPEIEILDANTNFVNDENQEIVEWSGSFIQTIGEIGNPENHSIEF